MATDRAELRRVCAAMFPPGAAFDADGGDMPAVLDGMVDFAAQMEEAAELLFEERINPRFALFAWEDAFGLPDDCLPADAAGEVAAEDRLTEIRQRLHGVEIDGRRVRVPRTLSDLRVFLRAAWESIGGNPADVDVAETGRAALTLPAALPATLGGGISLVITAPAEAHRPLTLPADLPADLATTRGRAFPASEMPGGQMASRE